jgi:hypothetical protein
MARFTVNGAELGHYGLAGFVQRVLTTAGIESKPLDKASALTERLYAQLLVQKTKLIVFDEFQQLYDRSVSTNVTYKAAEWVKGLVERKICSVVISGISTVTQALSENRQLHQRLTDAIQIEPMAMTELKGFSAFCNKYISASGVPFEGRETVEFARRLHLASHGYPGRAFKLLALAAERAIGEEAVTYEHLAITWANKNLAMEGVKNPFLIPLDHLIHFQNQPNYAGDLDERDTPPTARRRR